MNSLKAGIFQTLQRPAIGVAKEKKVAWILERYPHIRVVCITGYTPLVTEEPCGKGVPVIFKPFSIKDLEPYLKGH